MPNLEVKKKLIKVCSSQLEEQFIGLNNSLASIEESRNNETKSSVGDKYETGRAMMQLEHQKISAQLQRVKAQVSDLKTIKLTHISSKVGKGSLVTTSRGIYFISTAIGKVKLDEQVYFCISLESPIGKLLHRKEKGEVIQFNKTTIKVEKIS